MKNTELKESLDASLKDEYVSKILQNTCELLVAEIEKLEKEVEIAEQERDQAIADLNWKSNF